MPPAVFELSGDLNELSDGVSGFWVVSLVQKISIVYIFPYGIFMSWWQKSLFQSIFLMKKILFWEKKKKSWKVCYPCISYVARSVIAFPSNPGSLSACWSQWETTVSLFTSSCISFTEEKKEWRRTKNKETFLQTFESLLNHMSLENRKTWYIYENFHSNSCKKKAKYPPITAKTAGMGRMGHKEKSSEL